MPPAITLLACHFIASLSSSSGPPEGLGLVRTLLPSRTQVAQAELGAPGEFGADVELMGDLIAVGSPRASSDGGASRGLVSIHLIEGPTAAQAVLVPTGLSDGAQFGSSLASAGDLLAVGAPRADTDAGGLSGLVRVYRIGHPAATAATVRREGSMADRQAAAGPLPVALVAELGLVGAFEGAAFGATLAFDASGDRLAVGAPYSRGSAGVPLSGEVIVFRRYEGAWMREFSVSAPAPSIAATFGKAVDWVGDVLVCGAPGDGALAPGSGRVFGFSSAGAYLWERSVGGSASAAAGARYGDAITSLSPSTLAVGAFGRGLVEILRIRSDGALDMLGALQPEGGAAAAFGLELAAHGGILAVGAPRTDTLAVYRLAATGSVDPPELLMPPMNLGLGEFGLAAAVHVAASGSVVVAAGEPLGSAACAATGVRCAAGAVYVYRGNAGAIGAR